MNLVIRHTRGSLLLLSTLLATGAVVASPMAAEGQIAPKVFHACYVPATGTVYRIKEPGLKQNCTSPQHVAFSWIDGLPGHDHGNLNGLADDDHPEYVREGEAAGGDLGSSYPNPTVSGLKGRAVAGTAPSDGQVLTWNEGASEWEPQTAPSGVSDHGALTGLNDDDHPQYVHVGEVRTITAAHTFNPSAAGAPFALGPNATGQFIPGLNADHLDGQHGSFYLDASNLNAGVLSLARLPTDLSSKQVSGRAPLLPSASALGRLFVDSDDNQLYQDDGTAWVAVGAGGGVTDHGALNGLTDDDHPQYVLADGVRTSTDGFAVTGTLGFGTIPTTGAGVRLMWYPRKAAFRAGRVTGAQWDDTNIGSVSTAMGANTTASGSQSTAMGELSTASGSASTAMGQSTTASGTRSTAMGLSTTASGNSSTSMGQFTVASGGSSAAMGFTTTASGGASAALGFNTTAQAFASLVIGQFNVVAGDPASWIGSDPLFVAGNGSVVSPSNALTLDKDGNLSIAGTLTEASDIRLKEEVEPLEGVLDRVLELIPVRYRFREGTGHPRERKVGLSAQAVEPLFPELVMQGADGYLSVAYADLSAVLVRAVQEQQSEIDALRAELSELLDENGALEAEVAEVLRRLARMEGGGQAVE